MKKVYCENCKYYKPIYEPLSGFLIGTKCKKNATTEHTPVFEYKVYGDCEELNENNNCPYYKRKWWKFWVD